jgi:hypothetical protein
MKNRGQADQGESDAKNYQADAGRDFLKMMGSIHAKNWMIFSGVGPVGYRPIDRATQYK